MSQGKKLTFHWCIIAPKHSYIVCSANSSEYIWYECLGARILRWQVMNMFSIAIVDKKLNTRIALKNWKNNFFTTAIPKTRPHSCFFAIFHGWQWRPTMAPFYLSNSNLQKSLSNQDNVESFTCIWLRGMDDKWYTKEDSHYCQTGSGFDILFIYLFAPHPSPQR